MKDNEIEKGVNLVCEVSKEVKGFYDNPESLISALNTVPIDELDKCLNYYTGRTGVIVDLRKEVLNYLRAGKKLNSEILDNFINKHRSGKENQFRSYKQWFSIFYPPITFYGHNKIRKFIEDFIKQLIDELKLSNYVKSTYFDFQGARQQGSDRLWLAIYNKEQESQSSGIQFFVEFYNGKIAYGVYRHSDKSYLKERVLLDKSDFKYDDLLKYFKSAIPILKNNTPENVSGTSVDKVQSEISENLTENLNVILYGPPGTGKTYELSKYYFDKFTSKKSTVSREEFLKTFVIDLSWWEIIALVLLDIGKAKVADIFKHELLKLKASLSNSTTVTPTIWGQLQSHTIESSDTVNVIKRSSPLIFNKSDNSHWEILPEEVIQQAPELLEYQKEIQNFSEDSTIEIKRFEFVTFHQSFTYEDFIEGIKPNFDAKENDLTYIIEDGVFKKICLKARKDPDQNYAIFIDEINRGNISQIFGELITLIEDDKREGEENELSTVLPYSKTKFSVPTNLYIIGTMNTADRSIEALDTALRRRFSFIEMAPKPELVRTAGKTLDGILDGIDLFQLLTTINKRIEKLLDKDHMIGHSYFLSVSNLTDLKKVFQNKIIPLLQEYFFGDFGKIGLVLGSNFFELNNDFDNEEFFAPFDDYESSSLNERKIYNFQKVVEMKDVDFINAINILLRK
ncbi:McrB family protein [Daejeonella sp.]|uniref:McrB family protein n=1 Tax=Daejeonella sp. TaxID=2805397 RepID=UPI0027308FC4|nr:AAA family ATPase [Daejeonella sp.]MDP2415743.1 AAA family ATPase [Daejeonella sp.]